jgi:hypothetical protein
MSESNKTENPWTAWMSPFMTNPGQMNPFAGMPGAGMGAGLGNTPDVGAWMKALDPAEIERRIQELKVVEMWLQTQMNMVQMSVQTMTLQKQSMEALRSASHTVQEASIAPKARSTRKR